MSAAAEAGTETDTDSELSNDAWVVTAWTLISRITGFIRIAAAGAVFGPTLLSNIYQSAVVLPNIAYNLMAGSLIVSLVVPAIVGHLEKGDMERASRLAGSFMGVLLAASAVIAVVLAASSSGIAYLLNLSIEGDVTGASRDVTVFLILLVIPQVALYGIASVGAASQNARQRFALAAAAPVAENVLSIGSVAAFAWMGGGGISAEAVTEAQLFVLGLGSTAAVALHAALQWWGAARAGIVLLPRFGWGNPELRALVRRSGPAVATAVAQATVYFIMIIGAGAVPGGVIAIQLAAQTIQLPIALGARPVTVALLPRLSVRRRNNDTLGFIVDYREGLWLSGLTAVPAAVGLVAFAPYIASTIAVGRMSVDSAVQLVEVGLISLALSVIGIALAEVGRVALFAQDDFTTTAKASWVQVMIMGAGAFLALRLSDPIVVLAVIGISATLGELVAGGLIQYRAVRSVRAHWLIATSSALTMALAVGTLVVAGALTRALDVLAPLPDIGLLAIGGLVGMIMYFGLQFAMAPQFRRLSGGALAPMLDVYDKVGYDLTLLVAAVAVVLVANAAAVVAGWLIIGGLIALGIMVVVLARPEYSVYLYAATVPFVAGMDRGAILPQLRPNEAILAFVFAVVVARAMWLALLGAPARFRPTRLDVAVVIFVFFGSVIPILIMSARGIEATIEDFLEPLVLWRLLLIYILVRATIRNFDQVRRLLMITLGAACVLSVIAVLQGTGILAAIGVESIIETYWGESADGRAGTTLASSLATGAYLSYSLAIAIAWWGIAPREPRPDRPGTEGSASTTASAAVILIFLGGMASGQFSSWISVFLAAALAAYQVGRLGMIVRRSAPLLPIAALATWPVLSNRLSEFAGPFGMPRSWIGRIDNVTTFYLPPLFEQNGWILGVRPNSVLLAPEQWREEIFLESGYLWLLWVGGVPFFITFIYLLREAVKAGLAARTPRWESQVVGSATVASMACLMIVTLLDKHIQLRGAGDLLFLLLPLTVIGGGAARRQERAAEDENTILVQEREPSRRQPAEVGG